MKKILAVVLAAVMVMAMSVSAFAADDEVIFEYTAPFAVEIGWTILLNSTSEEAAAFHEAIQTEGAVIKMIGSDLPEDAYVDGEGHSWFQLAGQDDVDWGDPLVKTEDMGETYEFTDAGYVITCPAKPYYDAMVATGREPSHFNLTLNAGNWTDKVATHVTLQVVVPAVAEAPADDAAAEAPADDTAAETPAETPAETTAETPAETTAEAPETGLALAVIPAVVALAAAVVSKKH